MKETKDRLYEMINYFDIRQADVAKKTGLSTSIVSMYFSGKRVPAQDNIAKICNAYGVDPAWLIGYDVPMFPSKSIPDFAEEHVFLIEKFTRLSFENRELVMQLIDALANAER